MLRAAVVGLLAVVAVACASVFVDATSNASLAWSAKPIGSDHFASGGVVDDGVYFTGSFGGAGSGASSNFYALRVDSGQLLWNFTVGAAIGTTPATFSDLVIFGSFDFKIYALRKRDGSLAWNTTTGGMI